MAPRAYWKGYLKLALVSCPVVLYPATTQSGKTHFHQINRKTGNRLRQQMVDEETGEVVDREDKGRGYELRKGQYVEIEEEELDAIEIESNHTIEIDSFVPKEEIDERYLDHPYYLAPDGKAGAEAFVVIQSALAQQDRIALGRIVLTSREHVMALQPLGKGILGTTLRFDDEVRDEADYFADIPSMKVAKDLRDLAVHIMEMKAGHFDPAKFQDRYEDALKKLVKRKAAGKPIEAPPPPETSNVIDLMEALRRSIGGGTGGRKRGAGGGRKKPAAKAKRAPRKAAARKRKAA